MNRASSKILTKGNFRNKGQSLIGIIVVLVIVGLISGGLYYYLSKQIPEVPEIPKKPAEEIITPEEKVVTPPEKLPEEEVIPEKKPVIQKCTDGTLYGQCSTNKPKYCDNGNLINKASLCGCSTGYKISDNQCVAEITCQNECSSAGSKRCSGNGYQICENYDVDDCLEWSSGFSCAPSEVCQNGYCIIPQGSKLLLLVEDSLYNGLSQELNTYSNDIKREIGFETIVKTFSSSASVFEIKSYVKQIYNNYKLSGVLLIGDLPTGKFYGLVETGINLSDRVYQDIYDHCEYSKDYCWTIYGKAEEYKECGAFDWLSCGWTEEFWIARLTPNSSTKDSLSSLKDYFQRNHQYRTGGYSYKPKFLIYTPQYLEMGSEGAKEATAGVRSGVEFLNAYKENNYKIIDIEKENSDQLYLTEIKKPYEYEGVYVGAHGSPISHQSDIESNDIINSSFFLLDLFSCSVGDITTKDYIAGKYLFEGRGLVVVAAPQPTIVGMSIGFGYYPLTKGESLYRTLKPMPGLENIFVLGDPTLKMRYNVEKPVLHRSNDPIIVINKTSLELAPGQSKFDLKIKNFGKSSLNFNYDFKFYSTPKEYLGGACSEVENADSKVQIGGMKEWIVKPGKEAILSYNFSCGKLLPGSYKGLLSILSTDPVNPFIIIPFEGVVK